MSSSQSNLEQINYKQMRMMKSLYDESYDKAEEFINNRGGKEEPFTQTNYDSDDEEPFTQTNYDSDEEEPFTQTNYDSDDDSEYNDIKEGLKNKKKSTKKKSTKKKSTKKKSTNKKNKLEPKIQDEILKSIGVSDSDNKILKDALSVILVIGLTQISWKNIIHKTTGAVETTPFDKIFIVPVFKKVVENINFLMTAANTAKQAYTNRANMDLANLQNLASSALGANNDDMFDIEKWTTNKKVSFWLILYIPLLWLSRFMIGKFSDIINWFYNVQWKNIFDWLIFGKGSGNKLFPDLNLYSPPPNPLLITIFSVYFVYLAGKVFVDYMEFWIKIPFFFVIFLCLWFGAVMFPFLNISIFIFFAILAAYTLFMPLKFYYDNGKFFPHSFMDTLNTGLPGDENTGTKKFLDLTYRVFIFLSAIIFIYKSFKLSSTNLKTICASISIFFTLVWLTFTWKELKPSTQSEPQVNSEPANGEY
jgi:hypothetical protein